MDALSDPANIVLASIIPSLMNFNVPTSVFSLRNAYKYRQLVE